MYEYDNQVIFVDPYNIYFGIFAVMIGFETINILYLLSFDTKNTNTQHNSWFRYLYFYFEYKTGTNKY